MTAKIVSMETIYEGWSKFSRAMIQTSGKPFKREELARKVAEVLGDSASSAETGGKVVELRPRRDA